MWLYMCKLDLLFPVNIAAYYYTNDQNNQYTQWYTDFNGSIFAFRSMCMIWFSSRIR